MNTELFTGKAQVYIQSRPGYVSEAIDYIRSLVKPGAVFADIGAGTGKFTEQLARHGYDMYAVEPNRDMYQALAAALQPYPKAKAIQAPAEATALPDASVDAITCAQALHWFEPEGFKAECKRIARPGALLISVYNINPRGSSPAHSKNSAEIFFVNPTVREFPNPIFFTREHWLAYMTSHSYDPVPSDPGYDAHIAEMNAVFDKDSEDGLLRLDVVTRVYSEAIQTS